MERGGRISVKHSPNRGHRAWELSGVFTGGNSKAISASPEHTLPAVTQDTLRQLLSTSSKRTVLLPRLFLNLCAFKNLCVFPLGEESIIVLWYRQ